MHTMPVSSGAHSQPASQVVCYGYVELLWISMRMENPASADAGQGRRHLMPTCLSNCD